MPAYLKKYAPKAKRAVWLFMAGAPCQQDMFDYKPGLAKWFNKDLPEDIRGTAMPSGMPAGQNRFPVEAEVVRDLALAASGPSAVSKRAPRGPLRSPHAASDRHR